MRGLDTLTDVSSSGALNAGLLGAAAAASGVAVTLDPNAGPWEWAFGTVAIFAILTVMRLVVHAGYRAAREQAHESRLAATNPEEAATHAVIAERVRLAADTEAVVRAAVTEMAWLAEEADLEWDEDPVPSLRAVQDQGARASIELRRMLGLLRGASGDSGAEVRGVPPPASRIGRTDVAVATAVVVLAMLERVVFRESLQPGMDTTASAVLTALAATTVVGRHAAPALAGVAAGAIFMLAAVVGSPVTPGFWIIALGGLAWSSAAGRKPRDAVAVTALLGGVVVAMAWRDPDNMPAGGLVVGLGALGGLLAGWLDRREQAARERAGVRAVELAIAAEQAVSAERASVARDLHDVVSHAVGLMVMQAGAAEALRPVDLARAHKALDAVRLTASDALGELDRLFAAIRDGAMGAPAIAAGSVHKSTSDLDALAARMRAAGLDIQMSVEAPIAGVAGAAVYRIVQESLTNAALHAPGARVEINVQARQRAVTVEVIDDGPGPSGGSSRGYGLVGISERVHRLGGEFTTGPGHGSAGFRVGVRLPIRSPVG